MSLDKIEARDAAMREGGEPEYVKRLREAAIQVVDGTWAVAGDMIVTELHAVVSAAFCYAPRQAENLAYIAAACPTNIIRLLADYDRLRAAPPPPESEGLREAAEEFVRRVEAGEIRSKRSYRAFKAALAALPGQQGEHG